MDRKKFIATTSLFGFSSLLSVPKLFGQQTKPKKKIKTYERKNCA